MNRGTSARTAGFFYAIPLTDAGNSVFISNIIYMHHWKYYCVYITAILVCGAYMHSEPLKRTIIIVAVMVKKNIDIVYHQTSIEFFGCYYIRVQRNGEDKAMTVYSVGFNEEILKGFNIKADVVIFDYQKEKEYDPLNNTLYTWMTKDRFRENQTEYILNKGDTVVLSWLTDYADIYLMRKDEIEVKIIGWKFFGAFSDKYFLVD